MHLILIIPASLIALYQSSGIGITKYRASFSFHQSSNVTFTVERQNQIKYLTSFPIPLISLAEHKRFVLTYTVQK